MTPCKRKLCPVIEKVIVDHVKKEVLAEIDGNTPPYKTMVELSTELDKELANGYGHST